VKNPLADHTYPDPTDLQSVTRRGVLNINLTKSQKQNLKNS
jgi:hypothetical protein